MATINEALKKLFLGLGGDPDELKDNNTVSDYIDDLESAIETAASDASAELIDDEEASETKTYSSTKIESLIPENELPTPAAADIGKVVSVVTDGDEGAEYALELPENELPTPAVGDIGKVVSVVSDGESGAEYSLETPASGGGEPTIMAQITSISGSVSTSFMSGYKRRDVPKFKSDPTKYKISIFAMLANNKQLVGEVLCTGYSTAGGLVTPSGATFIGVMTDDAGDLYNVSIFLSDTNNTDKFVITPLTTT